VLDCPAELFSERTRLLPDLGEGFFIATVAGSVHQELFVSSTYYEEVWDMKNSRVLSFKDVMIVVILSIVCGVIYFGWGFLYNVMDAALPGSTEIIYGMWFIASVLCAYIVQKPGVAMLAELVASFVEMIFGGQWGVSTLIFGLLQGLGAEVIFAITRYRSYGWMTVSLAGIAAAILSVPIDYYQGYMSGLTTGVFILKVVIRLISGAILAGVLGKVLGNLLAKTGVLNNYAIARKDAENPFA
jgi:energy-coupling factor transport system substrate-specific component